MGAKETTLDNYVRTAKRPAPQGEPFMDQPRTGKLQRAADDAKAQGDMLSEGGPQEAGSPSPKARAR